MEKSSKSLWAGEKGQGTFKEHCHRQPSVAQAFCVPTTHPRPACLTLAMACEDAGSDATDVLLPDAGIVHLRPQARHREDVDITQVGEASKAGLSIVLRHHTGKCSQGYLPHTTAFMGCQLEFSLGTHLG